MIVVDKDIVASTIDKYGIVLQSVVCMEECAELIQAVSKEVRGKHDVGHISEEIADVYICLNMLIQLYNVPEGMVQAWVDAKQQRILERMKV